MTRLVHSVTVPHFYCGDYLIQRDHETAFYKVCEVPQNPEEHEFWGYTRWIARNCLAVVDDFGNLVRVQ